MASLGGAAKPRRYLETFPPEEYKDHRSVSVALLCIFTCFWVALSLRSHLSEASRVTLAAKFRSWHILFLVVLPAIFFGVSFLAWLGPHGVYCHRWFGLAFWDKYVTREVTDGLLGRPAIRGMNLGARSFAMAPASSILAENWLCSL